MQSELLNGMQEHNDAKEKYTRNITDKNIAISILKNIEEEKELYFVYKYEISDEIKTDKDIYNFIKSKLFFINETKIVNYTRSFVHAYGEVCGKSNDKNILIEAINEIENLPENYGYWLFYSLYSYNKIPFELYKKVYTHFNEISIKGFLLKHYCDSENSEIGKVIQLIDITSNECIQDCYFFITKKFHDTSMFDVLIRKGVPYDKLSENFQRNINCENMFVKMRKREKEEQEIQARKIKRIKYLKKIFLPWIKH